MLMCDQHLYKKPAIEVYGHSRLPSPWLRVSCWFFVQSRIEKLLAWAGGDGTQDLRDLSSQSGVDDLSVTVTCRSKIKVNCVFNEICYIYWSSNKHNYYNTSLPRFVGNIQLGREAPAQEPSKKGTECFEIQHKGSKE